ncbi:hypothetical protein OSB04_008397 [Centaurea solstitialis]|uniref:Retrotransposon gag domain-containing protein n=1 Tax=Centaurea solstitialis TaxID=347529 RepID=A0AA38WJF5_9ASTR|nr:hypothetical protein OSB04_008397 [Centaurea solstitialis]
MRVVEELLPLSLQELCLNVREISKESDNLVLDDGDYAKWSGMTSDQIRELVAEEVNHAFNDMIPELINQVRDQFTALLEERLATVTTAGGGPQRGFTYRDFAACSPPEFKGELDPSAALRWVMEWVFHTCGCLENLKVRYALNLLRGSAKEWWKLQAAN